ncbi:MAG: UDP-N-acetylmuramate dehydrogenase [Bacteroidota bacterium]
MWIPYKLSQMPISENISLKPYNSFGIDVATKYFAAFTSVEELQSLLTDSFLKPGVTKMILGGGSNVLFTKNFDGLILRNQLTGIELVKEDADHFYVKASAGENWHRFVLYCIENNYAGVENLSLIPGNVGASPMQNIGAYGVEIKDVFYELEAYHLQRHTIQTFSLSDCAFGYRESVFKKQYKGQYVILNVTFRLRKHAQFHTTYGVIEQELKKMNITTLSIRAISQAVIQIRSSKLPDPAVTGNAGSFFKNPVIASSFYDALKEKFPTIPGYAAGENETKLAAGWLIEQCGWKGYRNGDAGCYDKQALVLVNYGKATGTDIYALSQSVIESVFTRFGVLLEREVNII